jgi:hypothetical protein
MVDARCPTRQMHMAPKPVFAGLSPDVRMVKTPISAPSQSWVRVSELESWAFKEISQL